MTLAASAQTGGTTAGASPQEPFPFGPAAWLLAALAALAGLLAAVPDGVAEPLQAVIGWLMVGMAAAVALTAIVKGFERLLDCDSS